MTVRRAAAWSLASQYSTFALQFAATVIISRFFLSPADVGMFSIALAAAMVVAVFQDMGITRFVSGQQDMRPEHVREYSFVAVCIGWTIAAGLALIAPAIAGFYSEPRLAPLLYLIAASYLAAPFAIVPAALLVRAMDFRSLFIINAGSALLGYSASVLLAWQGFGPAALAWSVLVIAIARAALAMALRPVVPRLPRERDPLKPILNFSSASFVISASGAIGQRSQDLIVGRLLGLASTGLFSRAGALAAQLSTLIAGGLSTVFYSAFARKRDAGEPLAEPYVHLIACNTALNWAAMLGLAIAAEPLVLLLYGERWAEVARLLQWLAIAEMFFVAIPLQMDIPILLGRIKSLIWVNLLDTAAAVTILAIGASIGLQEAALSRVAYGAVWWTIYVVFLRRLLGFRLLDLLTVYFRSGICAIAAGLPLLIAGANGWRGASLGLGGLILLSGLGVLTWLIALWMTRHPAREEVRLAVTTVLPMLRPQTAA